MVLSDILQGRGELSAQKSRSLSRAQSVAAATSLALLRDDKRGRVCMARLKRLLKNEPTW